MPPIFNTATLKVGAAAVSAAFQGAVSVYGSGAVISNVVATPSGLSVTITFTTDIPAQGCVEYGTTTAYGFSLCEVSGGITSHSITITDAEMLAYGLWHFRVTALSAGSQLTVGDDATFVLGDGEIALRGTWNTGSGVNNVVSKPTGTLAGDLMLVHLHANGGGVTAPSGWVALPSGRSPDFTNVIKSFYKVCSDGEPSTFTFSSSASHAAVVQSFYNVDRTSPVLANSTGTTGGNSTTVTYPTLSSGASDNAMLVQIGFVVAEMPSLPAGYSDGGTVSSTTLNRYGRISHKKITPAGSVSGITSTLGVARQWAVNNLFLKKA